MATLTKMNHGFATLTNHCLTMLFVVKGSTNGTQYATKKVASYTFTIIKL